MSAPVPGPDPDVSDWADPAPTYDSAADSYAAQFLDELGDKPFDRDLLEHFARSVRPLASVSAPVCDVGCGPGHVGAYVAGLGLPVMGIDVSAGMVEVATRSFPGLEFRQGDMTSIPLADGSMSGIVCFYALIHIHRLRVPLALSEMRRVLVDGGELVVAVHGGEGSLHADVMAGQPADFDATLFGLSELSASVVEAGFKVLEAHERAPYPREHPTRRLYVWARRTT